MEAIIPVFPGTHHIKFLVDGAMETSPHLPTTVDFGNNLVNYIEVSGDDAAVRNIPVGATPPKDGREALRLPSRCTSEEYVKEVKPQQKKIVPIPDERAQTRAAAAALRKKNAQLQADGLLMCEPKPARDRTRKVPFFRSAW